jgi:hypothetical protein
MEIWMQINRRWTLLSPSVALKTPEHASALGSMAGSDLLQTLKGRP